MANIESNTLLEKMTQINAIKNRLRQVIINIGGGDYINEQSPFAAFPRALNRTFSDIKNTSRLLQYLDEGGDLNEIAEKDNLTYQDVLPYITNIMSSKQTLVDNLRIQGVYAEVTESLDSLVNKVLKITGGGDKPDYGTLIFSTEVSHNDYSINYSITNEGLDDEGNSYRVNFAVNNTSNKDIPGIIIKDITPDGTTHLMCIPNTIGAGVSHSIVYGYDENGLKELINRYTSETIVQFDTFDYCTETDIQADYSKLGYDSLLGHLVQYYSDYLDAYCSISKHSYNGEDTYYLANGLAEFCINSANEHEYNLMNCCGEGSAISFMDYSWFENFGHPGYDTLFAVTMEDFDWDLSEEKVIELYYKSLGGHRMEITQNEDTIDYYDLKTKLVIDYQGINSSIKGVVITNNSENSISITRVKTIYNDLVEFNETPDIVLLPGESTNINNSQYESYYHTYDESRDTLVLSVFYEIKS